MNRDEIRDQLLHILSDIAPDCDPAQIRPTGDLREQLDLDSLDFQRYVVRIHEQWNVEIPDRAYQRFTTLQGAIDFLAEAKTE